MVLWCLTALSLSLSLSLSPVRRILERRFCLFGFREIVPVSLHSRKAALLPVCVRSMRKKFVESLCFSHVRCTKKGGKGEKKKEKRNGGVPDPSQALELVRLASHVLQHRHLFRIIHVHPRLERLQSASELISFLIHHRASEFLRTARNARRGPWHLYRSRDFSPLQSALEAISHYVVDPPRDLRGQVKNSKSRGCGAVMTTVRPVCTSEKSTVFSIRSKTRAAEVKVGKVTGRHLFFSPQKTLGPSSTVNTVKRRRQRGRRGRVSCYILYLFIL